MESGKGISRRVAVKSTIFGVIAVSVPNFLQAKSALLLPPNDEKTDLPARYPAIDDQIVSEVVGVSHFDLDRLKVLVDKRPELSRATWDWGFGDWESAIGAASHVGRRDIVTYLMEKGAHPTIHTFAMMGDYLSVKSLIESFPGIQKTAGPHGISLLQHAKFGLEDTLSRQQQENSKKLIDYLEELGDAHPADIFTDLTAEQKALFLGDYKYGEGEKDGFSIKLNMRKLLALGKIGSFGGALYHKGNYHFEYNGAPSVNIHFEVEQNVVKSLTISEPDLTLKAIKI